MEDFSLEAYTEGRAAFTMGCDVDPNPYRLHADQSLAGDFSDGWNDAQAEFYSQKHKEEEQ